MSQGSKKSDRAGDSAHDTLSSKSQKHTISRYNASEITIGQVKRAPVVPKPVLAAQQKTPKTIFALLKEENKVGLSGADE